MACVRVRTNVKAILPTFAKAVPEEVLIGQVPPRSAHYRAGTNERFKLAKAHDLHDEFHGYDFIDACNVLLHPSCFALFVS